MFLASFQILGSLAERRGERVAQPNWVEQPPSSDSAWTSTAHQSGASLRTVRIA
jgi:hypothetical protein